MSKKTLVSSDFEIRPGLFQVTVYTLFLTVFISTFIDFGAGNLWAGWSDIVVMAVVLCAFILNRCGVLRRNSSLGVIVYVSMANFLLETLRLFLAHDLLFPYHLVFNLFAMAVFMGVAGYIVHRAASLVVGIGMTIFAVTLTILSGSEVLMSYIHMFPFFLIGFAVILFNYRGGLEGIVAQVKINNIILEQQKEELERLKAETETAYAELKRTQNRIIAQEKLASLGSLTAGIAHEIKNPLNFITNFAQSSIELMAELEDHITKVRGQLSGADQDDVDYLLGELKQNMHDISQHGQRGDRIVKSMLMHSRGGEGVFTKEDVNLLAEECLNLAFHGLRAADTAFQSARDFSPATDLPAVDMARADLSRVLLNLCNNAFYAVNKRRQAEGQGYQARVAVSLRQDGDMVEIRVSDNGTGMSEEVRTKVFQPFFTTKPTGEGTGLGLSLSHDIVVQEHGGTIDVESSPGEGATFVVRIPLLHSEGGEA